MERKRTKGVGKSLNTREGNIDTREEDLKTREENLNMEETLNTLEKCVKKNLEVKA